MEKTTLIRLVLFALGLYWLFKGLAITNECSMYKCIILPKCTYAPFYMLGGIIFLIMSWVVKGDA